MFDHVEIIALWMERLFIFSLGAFQFNLFVFKKMLRSQPAPILNMLWKLKVKTKCSLTYWNVSGEGFSLVDQDSTQPNLCLEPWPRKHRNSLSHFQKVDWSVAQELLIGYIPKGNPNEVF